MRTPTAYDTVRQRVAFLPLAIILVLHLALLFLWTTNARVHGVALAEQRHFILTWLPPIKHQAPAIPQRAPTPKEATTPATAPTARASRAAPIAAVPPLQIAPVEPDTPQANNAPPAIRSEGLDASELIANARRQAGNVDRELRGGKTAALTAAPDLPITRLREGLESAYIDRSRVMVTDTYTQADGVVFYRFQYAGKVWCRQSGGIGPGMEPTDGAKLAGAGSRGGAGQAGHVSCPSGAAWSRR